MLQAEIEQKNLEEEQQRLQFQHQLQLEQNEKEIIQLKNEKLQTDIELKNTELASSAMHLVQKGELLTTIKEELMRLKNNAEIEKDSKDFKKMIKIIDSQLDTDLEWEQFATHFDSVHTNYLKHIKERFPDLTASELKLCAYLRLSLSSKEIAQLMNISIRGVETSRYRLRKKLGITGDTNLFDFLLTAGN
jgi:DNA-binding CsgD family transcriptional regulator